jgi:hypothetical protein
MNDNPKDNMPARDRVSIRAVLLEDGEDIAAALIQAGIYDPVAIPVVFGESPSLPTGMLGDGVTPNLTAVLETEQPDEADASAETQRARPRPDPISPAQSPNTHRTKPLAPIRQTRA